jgi:hypothetical protein
VQAYAANRRSFAVTSETQDRLAALVIVVTNDCDIIISHREFVIRKCDSVKLTG